MAFAIASKAQTRHTTIAKAPSHYDERVAEFGRRHNVDSTTIVMLGNSLTEYGGDWGKRLGADVANYGIIGDHLGGMLRRLHQVTEHHPKAIFFMGGINDVNSKTSASMIFARQKKLIESIQRQSPQTRIYVESLLPINLSVKQWRPLIGQAHKIPEINKQLKAYCEEKGLTFIDLYPLLTDSDGTTLRRELTRDGLHLTEAGYDIWVDKIKPLVKQIASPLHQVFILGDSNTWIGGDDCTGLRCWSYWFEHNMTGVRCRSYARSGATWTNTAATTPDTKDSVAVLNDNNVIFNQVQRVIEAIPHPATTADTPTFIIFAGTNDAWFQARRPGIFDKSVDEVFADTTLTQRKPSEVLSLAGAIRYNCTLLEQHFPDSRIVLVTPMFTTQASKEAVHHVSDIIDSCGKRLGIPVIRLDSEDIIDSDVEKEKKTLTADGTHTNEAGGHRIGESIAHYFKDKNIIR